MSQSDAYELLASELNAYRDLGHDGLRSLIGTKSSEVVRGGDDRQYLIEVAVEWADQGQDEILVTAMAALRSTGPLRRIDRVYVSTAAGWQSV